MTTKSVTTAPASAAKLDLYLDRLAARHVPTGNLIFSLDATGSREQAWDAAVTLTASMFEAVGNKLNLQLVYYGGVKTFRWTGWVSDARAFNAPMSKVRCDTGATQITRLLDHAKKENTKRKISALVFVGDAFEEDADAVCAMAKELPFPVFLFQEGNDEHAAEVFAAIAEATGGAHCQFDKGSAKQLAELLGAIAAYAAGGTKALKDMSTNAGAVKLLQHLKK